MEQGIPLRPKNWLAESILVTLFCCLPFGIVGIVNAANVNAKYDAGDIAGALAASKEAGKWTKIGFWIGVGQWGLIIIFYGLFFGIMIAGIAGAAAASPY